MSTKLQTLRDTSFGFRIAEDETDALETYFVETESWRKLFSGEVDVVYGPKGSGKSALYTLLVKRSDQLFDRKVIAKAGENPRGAPAFKDLAVDPPTSESEFVGLWKLYCLCLLAELFREFGCNGTEAKTIRAALEKEGLLPSGSLKALLRGALDYVRAATRIAGIETGIGLDPVTGMPNGFNGKITFHEPSASARQRGIVSVDELLATANTELTRQDFTAWILLDRLDVAFAESPDLEQAALRALFKAYLDMLALDRIRLKIFLRTDIWRRITSGGFREASHITRTMTIVWDRRSLVNLVIRRAAQNPPLQSYYSADPDEVLESAATQEAFFYRMAPDQVDVGPNKPSTVDWVLTRCRDASKQTAPREVIHLLSALRDEQIRRLELGDPEPEGELLFARTSFKEALRPVSKVRLEQTIYAEYPSLKEPLEKLRGEKTSYRTRSLADLWNISEEEAMRLAQQLAEVGIFEVRGSRSDPEYWVPFLYRDALDLVQGSADV